MNDAQTDGSLCGSGPMKVAARVSIGIKWCFRCRNRREFHHIIETPTTPGYWGLTATVECGHCGAVDGDLFPGQAREWA